MRWFERLRVAWERFWNADVEITIRPPSPFPYTDPFTFEDPFDHDKNKAPGGSLPASERGLDDLRAKYEVVTGRKPDRRWGAKTLQAKIDLKQVRSDA